MSPLPLVKNNVVQVLAVFALLVGCVLVECELSGIPEFSASLAFVVVVFFLVSDGFVVLVFLVPFSFYRFVRTIFLF